MTDEAEFLREWLSGRDNIQIVTTQENIDRIIEKSSLKSEESGRE